MSRMDYNDDKNKTTTTTTSPIINNQTSNNRRRLKKCITYSCGSNVDGRLGLGGDHDESCRTVLTPLPPFQRRRLRRRRRSGRGEDMTSCREEEMTDDVDNEEDVIDDDDINEDHGTNSIVMSSGRAHTLLCDDGIVYSWGANGWGQLGFDPDGEDEEEEEDDYEGKACFQPRHITSLVNDERESSSLPSREEEEEECSGNEVKKSSSLTRDVSSGVRIVTLACGYNHSLIISSTGQLYTFGCNTHGELGHGDTISRWRPSPLPPPPQNTKSSFIIVAAAGGLHHSLVLTIKGVVYAFGRGQEGQLGDGCCSISSSSPQTTIIPNHKSTKPQKTITTNNDGTATMDNERVLLIAASRGGHGSYAVTLSGRGWYWGVIASDNFDVIDRPTPLPPPLGSSSSLHHAIHGGGGARPSPLTTTTTSSPTTTQTLFATLSKTPPTPPQHKPLSSSLTSSHRIISLSAGSSHAIFITLSGEAYALGNPGPHLGLGPGNSFIWKTPSRCLLPGAVLVNGVCCGVEHTVLSTTCGRVLMCGDGRWGKLGLEGEGVLEVAGGREGVAREVEVRCGGEEGWGGGVSEFGGEGLYGYHKIVGHLGERGEEDEDEEEMTAVARVMSDVDIDDYEIPRDVKEEEDNNNDDDDDDDDDDVENNAKEDFESFEDDEDYWGEDGLGHELELDFNLGSVVSSNNPFGTIPTDSTSCGGGTMRSLLGSETTRRLSRSTRAVGGVLYNTGGAVISAVKNRVRGESISSESTDGMATATTATTTKAIPIQSSSSGTDKEKGKFAVGSLDSHQDSFNGLAGKASRKILLSAGLCHTCVRVLDYVDD